MGVAPVLRLLVSLVGTKLEGCPTKSAADIRSDGGREQEQPWTGPLGRVW